MNSTASVSILAAKKKMNVRIATAKKQAESAKQGMKQAKAALKLARQEFKAAKRLAKKRRKEVKTLKAELAALNAKKPVRKTAAPRGTKRVRPVLKLTATATPSDTSGVIPPPADPAASNPPAQ